MFKLVPPQNLSFFRVEKIQFQSMSGSQQEERIEAADNNTPTLVSFLMNSNYFQYLRNTYSHFLQLQEEQKNALVKNAQIFRIKQQHNSFVVNFKQPTLSIVIYGELKIDNKTYGKGTYFVSEPRTVHIDCLKKTAILVLNSQEIDTLMAEYQQFYSQKDIVEKTLPTEILGLQRKDYKIICSQAKFIENKSSPPYSLAFQGKEGVYLLYEGSFSLLTQDKIRVSELIVDHYGEECLWGESCKYKLKPESYDHKYMWISKEVLLMVFSSETIQQFKEVYDKRQAFRAQIERRCRQNLEETKIYLKGQIKKQEIHNLCQAKRITSSRYTAEEREEFNKILLYMNRKTFKPKWKREEEQEKEKKLLKLKAKGVYMPKKAKSRYFSTLTNKNSPSDYHGIIHKADTDPFSLKLHIEERAPTQILKHRRPRTEGNIRSIDAQRKRLQSEEVIRRKTSHGYYSYNYDRSYSHGMMRLAKMQKFDQMKQSSRLKRGQKIMTTEQLTVDLSDSLGQLNKTLISHRVPTSLTAYKTMHLQKKMIKNQGPATWR